MTVPNIASTIADEYDWQRDLKRALIRLPEKKYDIDLMWAYYEGDHPQLWMTEKLRTMFAALADHMVENYCEIAVDSTVRRMEITGFTVSKDLEQQDSGEEGASTAPQALVSGDDELFDKIFRDNGLYLEQSEYIRAARVAGEAFAILWLGEDGPEIHLNDARNVYWHRPKHTSNRHAVKVWADEDEERWRATIYYDDGNQVRLVGPALKSTGLENVLPDVKKFEPDSEDPGGPTGFDFMPVFRFADREKRTSYLKSLSKIQAKINKLESNKMVAAEFGAFQQRAYLTTQKLDKDAVRQEPDHAIVLDPGGDSETGVAATSVHEFSATELSNYDNTIQREVNAFFTTGNLPKHLMVNPGASPSGAAITADEGPFVEMIKDVQRFFTATWKEIAAAFGLNVEVMWRDPSTEDSLTTATTTKTYVDAGVPTDLALKKYAGWDGAELDELNQKNEAQQANEQAAREATLAALEAGQGQGMNLNQPGLVTPQPDEGVA